MPDQTQGGCAPVSNPGGGATTGCGDRTPFDDMTKTASHELMEAITDPRPLDDPACTAPFIGENGDLCNFSTIGDESFTTVVDAHGTAWAAQKGFSNVAFNAGQGQRRGCVGYPTTACCEPTHDTCTWVQGGSSCPQPPASGMMVTLPLPNGLGTPNITFRPYFDGGKFFRSPMCWKVVGGTQPSWCVDVASLATTASVTVTLGTNYADSGAGDMVDCRTGDCSTPLGYVRDGAGNRVYTVSSGGPAAPAVGRRLGLILLCGILLGLGWGTLPRRPSC
jgi:hypothetical protein